MENSEFKLAVLGSKIDFMSYSACAGGFGKIHIIQMQVVKFSI